MPSTRIVVLNMFPYLRAANFDPYIVFEPAASTAMPVLPDLAAQLKSQGFHIIFFQKVHSPSAVTLACKLRAAGIKTVFGICDYVQLPMVEATDATIAVTDHLKSLHPAALQSKIYVVHDGIEQPTLHKSSWGTHRGSISRPLKAVLVTSVGLTRLPVLISPPGWLEVTIVGAYAPALQRLQRWRDALWEFRVKKGLSEKLQYLRFVLNPRIKRLAWDATDVYTQTEQADIGIIPIESDIKQGALTGWQMKSENRLTLKMAMGLPVVATPIPSYLPVVQHGVNGFLAHDPTEWLSCLTALRDPEFRKSMGQQARQTAVTRYSMDRQAEKLIGVLRSLVDQGID